MSIMKKQGYKISEEIKEYLIKTFNLDEKLHFIFDYYNDQIRDSIKGSYLAHYIRALEQELKKYTKNPLFSIIVKPLNTESKNFNVGLAQYYHKRYAVIYYHPNMDEFQLRDCLAHEIGHIFICTLLSSEIDPNDFYAEPFASLIGILFMIDTNDFYKNRCSVYSQRDYKEIVHNFNHINERKKQNKFK